MVRLKQLTERIGLRRSTIYDRMDKLSPRYDPSFPLPIKLGAGAIGWIDSEITAWIEKRMSAKKAR
ncbi:AlpA family phage regulatory protein [Pseudomonas syringae pv. maculicola]|nr:AlpA family phage regulatory protein [Pseudomonas syringae pv. maculicola]